VTRSKGIGERCIRDVTGTGEHEGMPIARAVFDLMDRSDPSPSLHNESNAAFLNRVSGDYWDQVRELVEAWVDHYPAVARPDIVGRLRSSNNRHFGGAFWELYLHESFLRNGFDVQVHPSAPSGSRVPDFLVSRGEESYLVEARAIFESLDAGAEARLRQVYDEINKVDDPNFFVDLDVYSVGPVALTAKTLRRTLESWLASLDPDRVEPLLDIE
jgi:hypothetical protein